MARQTVPPESQIFTAGPHAHAESTHVSTWRARAIAVFLIFGLLTNLTCVVSLLLSLGIWSVGEGFGGPYSVDQWLTRRLGRFGFLAAGVPWHRRPRPPLK